MLSFRWGVLVLYCEIITQLDGTDFYPDQTDLLNVVCQLTSVANFSINIQ